MLCIVLVVIRQNRIFRLSKNGSGKQRKENNCLFYNLIVKSFAHSVMSIFSTFTTTDKDKAKYKKSVGKVNSFLAVEVLPPVIFSQQNRLCHLNINIPQFLCALPNFFLAKQTEEHV